MPLLDHFHPPLALNRHWESFHSTWANEIMRSLNRRILPAGYFAEAQIHVGSRFEVDVATLDEDEEPGNGSAGGVAVQTWTPPKVTRVIPAVFPDEIEVQVFAASGGATLVGAIEFVSPGNKDRPETRKAFAAKCASFLHAGVGLLVVDVVTDRQANLHDELMELMGRPDAGFASPTSLYVSAYRPARRASGDEIDLWLEPLSLGQPLPTMPLALRGSVTLPLDLEASYREVCLDSRLG